MNPGSTVLRSVLTTFLMLAGSGAAVTAYYHIKPAIPRIIRQTIRQRLASRQRQRYTGSWPILHQAGAKPLNWQGWPQDRQFALVLTHDVETQLGLRRIKALAEMEMSLGFRSSFNFVPEGSYTVQPQLLRWLSDRGFEIGVHDHRHDGKLYRSHSHFRASALRINHFLREWNAVGFRSGFMLRNLAWIRELEVQYDASTFDTDPFEPQPQGANTIFPFWVGAPHRQGYVELPYTLPQDSTLFLLLKERTNQIWKDKIAWIASRGGMALINVHPDYLSFRTPANRYERSVEHYRDFLEHVKSTYAGAYWFALPKHVAAFYRDTHFAGIDHPSLPCSRNRKASGSLTLAAARIVAGAPKPNSTLGTKSPSDRGTCS